MVTASSIISLAIMFGLGLLFIFSIFALLGGKSLKRKFYKIFKKKEIERISKIARENENNPLYITFGKRLEQYIKLGCHNPTVIENIEISWDKYKKTKEIRNFIGNAVQKGYSIREAKKLASRQYGFDKKLIKLALKLNKKEDKNYDVQEEAGQIPRIEEPVGSTANADGYEPRGRSAIAPDGYGEPRVEPRAVAREPVPREPRTIPRASTGAGRGGVEPRGYGTNIEAGRVRRNEPRSIARTTTTQSRTVPSNPARTSTNSQSARQRNIQARNVKKPVEKSGYFN